MLRNQSIDNFVGPLDKLNVMSKGSLIFSVYSQTAHGKLLIIEVGRQLYLEGAIVRISKWNESILSDFYLHPYSCVCILLLHCSSFRWNGWLKMPH